MELRISTTTIDYFNRMLLMDNVAEEDFLKSVKGESEKTKFMELGTSFHEILEKPYESYKRYVSNIENPTHGFLSESGISFPFELISECFGYVDYNFPFEVKHCKDYEVNGYLVKVVAKADQLQGNCVNEHKSNWTGFSYAKYAMSLQKDFYFDIFNADRVNYKVFEMYDGANGIILKGIHQFYFARDFGVGYRINRALNQIVDYIETKNLFEYFKPKVEENVLNRVFS